MDILSTDLILGQDGTIRMGYGVRSGTSASTVFVSALAAKILAEEPHLSPAQVKKRLLAYAQPIEESDGLRYLFGGNGRAGSTQKSAVAAGRISSFSFPRQSTGNAAVLTNDGGLLVGSVRFNSTLREFILFSHLSGGTARERKCPVHKIFRLSRTEDNQFSILCEGNDGQLRFYDSHYLKPLVGLGMSCLYRGSPCLWFTPSEDTTSGFPLDLSTIQEIYFDF